MMLQVLEWCPKNNLVRKVLGAIKVQVQSVSLLTFCIALRLFTSFILSCPA